MSKEAEALQKRSEEIGDWAEKRGMERPEDEDCELLLFNYSKVGAMVLEGHDPMKALTSALATCYVIGYKKGYEVKELEQIAK